MNSIKEVYKKIGFPRLIISLTLILFMVGAAALDISIAALLSDMLIRFGMNAIMEIGRAHV